MINLPYKNEVVIRTNLGKLIVNAPSDTVSHYGEVENVDIKAVDKIASYHEYGKAGYVEIAVGHFVAENNSKVIALVNTGSKADVTIDADSTANIVQAITTNADAAGTAHGGNVSLTSQTLTAEEKNNIIYNAEAIVANAVIVDGKYYKTLQEAFDKAPKDNGGNYDLSSAKTIVLLKDLTDGGLYTSDNNTISGEITIDLNGYTYTAINGAGSSGTPSQAMHFGSTKVKITMKNGNFVVGTGSATISMAAQIYCEFEAENVNFDFTNIIVSKYPSSYGPVWGGLEVPMFNSYEKITLTDCTLTLPNDSTKGFNVFADRTGSSTSATATLTRTKINGYIVAEKPGTLTLDSTSSFLGTPSSYPSGQVDFSSSTSGDKTIWTATSK